MSDFSFDVSFSSSALDLVEKAKKAIVGAGGEVQGDVSAGSFFIPSPLGKIAGNYTISQQSANFVITEKPMFISGGLIESTLRKYISEEQV